MNCWMSWHGGANYAAPELRDVESFGSLRAARDAFWRRGDFDPFYPCVGEDATAYIYLRDPRGEHDPYPDRILSYGPRGGVRLELA